ncbi:MAG: hypothetical protein E7B94_11780, partial [Enterobacter sp.]|nr:hypothetical protein [Enterobacter sp.]
TLSDAQYSYGRIQKLLLDVRVATVEIITPELEKSGDCIIGGLIDHYMIDQSPYYTVAAFLQLWRYNFNSCDAQI